MKIKVIGEKEISKALQEISDNLANDEFVFDRLISILDREVPVLTGYLRDHTERSSWELRYTAPYAGYVEERDGFAQDSIDQFSVEDYADKIVEPF